MLFHTIGGLSLTSIRNCDHHMNAGRSYEHWLIRANDSSQEAAHTRRECRSSPNMPSDMLELPPLSACGVRQVACVQTQFDASDIQTMMTIATYRHIEGSVKA